MAAKASYGRRTTVKSSKHGNKKVSLQYETIFSGNIMDNDYKYDSGADDDDIHKILIILITMCVIFAKSRCPYRISLVLSYHYVF